MNGQRYMSIPICSSIRQGCSMSILLFALCLNPFLFTLERNLVGIRFWLSGAKTTAVAYAYDVTIL